MWSIPKILKSFMVGRNMHNEYEQCADCWRTYHTAIMDYDFDTEEWVCNDCFEERAWTAIEKDQDEV